MRATERERTLTKAGLEGRLTSSDGGVRIDVIVDDGVTINLSKESKKEEKACLRKTVNTEKMGREEVTQRALGT